MKLSITAVLVLANGIAGMPWFSKPAKHALAAAESPGEDITLVFHPLHPMVPEREARCAAIVGH